ncbi:dipicolinic acid synthetase B subunit [Clostridium sp. CAG:921]|nr:dipicolinic acid synthetase B subunit [Clostridium sp. CAG:921]
MKLENITIGLCITGSFCNFNMTKDVIRSLMQEGATVIPIISNNVKKLDTRFYKAKEFVQMVEDETKNKVIDSIVKAEPIGPKNMVDILVICPCTGNTLAKLANGITDTTVTMAVKSHIRNNKPVVIGISTNDGLGKTLKNIAEIIDTKNYFFVPFSQDNYISKPKSLVLDYEKLVDTIKLGMEFKQIQPILK